MNIQKSILSDIFKGISFSQREIILVESNFEKLNLKKRVTLLDAGKRVNHQYFICSGCLRTYFIDNSGKEHTIQFAIKDW